MSSIEHDKQLARLKAVCLSKVGHRYKTSAEHALDNMVRLPYSSRLEIYTCPICKLFHIGKPNEQFLKQRKDDNNSKTI